MTFHSVTRGQVAIQSRRSMVSISNVLGVDEVKTTRFMKAVVCEVLGVCMLVVVGCGSVATLSEPKGKTDLLAVSFAFGLAVMMMVWMVGHISGAHINPSVSLGFLVTGHISILKCLCYLAAQMLGGLAGTALLWLMLPDRMRGNLGTPALGRDVADWQGVIVELTGTFLLVMTVFASCDKLRTDHQGSAALAIGLCVAAQVLWMANLTGGNMNPARSLGPAIFAGEWDNHWVYWTGPIAGGILAALVYERIFAERTKETEKELHRQYNNCQVKSNGFLEYVIDIEAPESDNSSQERPPKYSRPSNHHNNNNNNNNNNSDEVIKLEDNDSKAQMFKKTKMAFGSSNNRISCTENCVSLDEDESEQSSVENTSAL